MKKIVFFLALATVSIAHCKAANETDTLRTYNIDGVHIKNFTGQELEGKTIKSYKILYATVPADNHVLETHFIKTTTPPAKKSLEPRYFLDGKEIGKTEMDKISPSKIESIEVLKAGSKAAQEYSKDGDQRGIVLIHTKK